MIEYARRAFKVPPEVHARALRAAGSERPPTVVLGCVVIEADGLEAKDANGKILLLVTKQIRVLGICLPKMPIQYPFEDTHVEILSDHSLIFKRRGNYRI